eukprot:4856852-Ditylum_brightwellii.AAC.1
MRAGEVNTERDSKYILFYHDDKEEKECAALEKDNKQPLKERRDHKCEHNCSSADKEKGSRIQGVQKDTAENWILAEEDEEEEDYPPDVAPDTTQNATQDDEEGWEAFDPDAGVNLVEDDEDKQKEDNNDDKHVFAPDDEDDQSGFQGCDSTVPEIELAQAVDISLQLEPELLRVSAVGDAPLTPLEPVNTATKPMDILDLEFPIPEDQNLSTIGDTAKDAFINL